MHYPKALTPTQSEDMHEFLLNLQNVNKVAIELGQKVDVGKFISVWSGRSLTGEDKKKYNRCYMRARVELKKVSHA